MVEDGDVAVFDDEGDAGVFVGEADADVDEADLHVTYGMEAAVSPLRSRAGPPGPRRSKMVLQPMLVANYDFQLGGGEVGLLMLANGLRRRGHRVRIAVPGLGDLAAGFDRVVYDPRLPTIDGDLVRIAQDADVIHVYSASTMAALHRAQVQKPIVYHVLVPNPHPADRDMAATASVVICNSQATAGRFAGAPNIEVVYNGVAEPHPPTTELGIDPTRRTIAIIGGTVLRKGQVDVLPALLEVIAATDDVDVVFIGRTGGAEAMRLRRHASTSNGRVRLLGYIPGVANHFSAFAMVIVPSRSEGFGRVAVEALRAGTPVLARRVEGLKEALADLADPWLPPQRTDWTNRILQELHCPTHSPDELKAAARRFEPDRFVDRVEAIYRQVTTTTQVAE